MAILSDQTSHLRVMAPSNFDTAVANTESSEKELAVQDTISESDPLPAVSKDPACEAQKFGKAQELGCGQESVDVETPALGSPFPSPKLVPDDYKIIISLEEREAVKKNRSKSFVSSPVLPENLEGQFNKNTELKLASSIVEKESLVVSSPEGHAGTADVDIETEDSDSKTDSDVTVELSKFPKSACSLPPRMRPEFQLPPSRHFSQDSRHMIPPNEVVRSNEGPRAPGSYHTSYQPRGDHKDREQFARMSAQLMKTKHELDTERNKNQRLRSTIEAEQQQKIEAASASILSNLLRDQAEALTLKAKVEARERELDLREKRISQHEIYLSEGQKQLWFSLEENGVRPMSAVQMELARREAELNAQKAIADVNGKLNIKIEGLRLREAAQQMREQQYKAMVRDSLQAEFTENSLTTEKADEIAEIEYNNGFGAGKEAGRREAHEKSHQRGFLEGYGACHRTQATLSKIRQGLIPRDSPELDFLYDANHAHNLYRIGSLFGHMEAETNASKKGQEMKIEQKKPVINGSIHNGAEEPRDMTARVNDGTNGTVAHEREEPVCKMPSARPTFAAELRGPSATHHGHIILANNAAPLAAKETERPIIKYENDAVNLIDFM